MPNLLKNADFNDPPAAPTLLIGNIGNAFKSAAKDWKTYNNSAHYTSTAIIKLSDVDVQLHPPQKADFLATAPPGTKQVLEVCTNGALSGIFQNFGHPPAPPAKATGSSVWVFVLRGQVGMGAGLGGSGGIDVSSAIPNKFQWEHLHIKYLPLRPVTEFIVYSHTNSTDGAWYFVADAVVDG
jgi:hypothetical protein